MKVSFKLIRRFLMGMDQHSRNFQNNKFAMSLQHLIKEVRDKVDFLHADKRQVFLQVEFNTLIIKVSLMVILLLLMGMIKHSQITQSSKFAISSQYLRKEVIDGVYFLHADKHQSFHKLALSFLMEVTRQVQSTQNRKLVIFLQYLQKKKHYIQNFVFKRSLVISYFQADIILLGGMKNKKNFKHLP